MTFNNDKATDDERVEFLDNKEAMVEDHGDEENPEWMLFYKGTNGNDKSLRLDAQSYEDALFESCNFLSLGSSTGGVPVTPKGLTDA